MDVRSMFDKAFLYHFDLQGRDVTVVISKVTQGKVMGTDGKAQKKPVVYFEGKEKGLALNITNVRTIGSIYGTFEADKWVGKTITLFPTTTSMAGRTVECIRVRPAKPGKNAPIDTSPDAAPPAREPGDDDTEEAAS
jgi:hypothetical protein